jgi:uncharacterized membrane protein YfhO
VNLTWLCIGRLYGSEPSWPGWKVQCNGKNVRPIESNGAFLSFVVQPGESDVGVFYRPMSFTVGLSVAIITTIGLVTVPIVRRRAFASPA